MQSESEKTKIGTFRIGKIKAIGHVSFAGKKTNVRLSSGKFYSFGKKEGIRIHGTLTDHEKITLVDCVTSTVPGTTTTPNGRSHHADVFPHYIVTGTRHIEPDQESVRAIELWIENAHVLFWDYTAFGSSLVNAEVGKSILTQLTSGFGKPPEIGEHPEILYFTGKYQILSAETSLGRIVVSHRPTFTSPSTKGIRVKNSIPLRIEFEKRLTFHDAFDRALQLLVFVDLLLGTKHRIKRSTIALARKSKKSPLDVYQSMAPRGRGKRNSARAHPGDVLINGGIQPDSFSAVLTAWLSRQTDWRAARFRFIENLRKQNTYTIDRLVAAANLFDILPESAVGGRPKISEDLAKSTADAKKLFRKLPQSPERESVLSALGRVGAQNLRTKVTHRAKFITDKIGERFVDLDLVIGAAINTRNFFVHGSPGKLSPADCFQFSPFFTDTLEFIFGAADLIEAGWDVEAWIKRGTTMSHPFGRYRVVYGENLANLKRKLHQTASGG